MEMETQFLYQNAETGNPSNTPLSTPVICRILNSEVMSLVTRDTLVIPFDPIARTYGSQGWLPVRDVPVLNAAGSRWYYTDADGTNVFGPVSCSTLMVKLQGYLDVNDVKVFNASATESEGTTRNEWKLVKNVPGLKAAMSVLSLKMKENGKESENVESLVDNSVMVYEEEEENSSDIVVDKEEKAAELNAFLASTSGVDFYEDEKSEDEEAYHSDGGTEYVKCESTGQWIEAKLMRSRRRSVNKKRLRESNVSGINIKPTITSLSMKSNECSKTRKKTANFAAKKAKTWIYVTGLPSDTNEIEVAQVFARAGIIDLDPESQLPKIKLYRYKDSVDVENGKRIGDLKGDASICYARPESVDLAIQILDESMFRAISEFPIRVSRAKFEQKGDTFVKNSISLVKRKVAKLAAVQAVCWDEGDSGRLTGGKKGLRIIVLKGMFKPKDMTTDKGLHELETKVLGECSKYGAVEKITVFSKNRAGVVVVKFTQPAAASATIKAYHSIFIGGKRIEATFWDGVTDFTIRDEEKETKEAERRHQEFGEWLDQQQLPEHLRLRVEGEA